jgi:hypothetical protein
MGMGRVNFVHQHAQGLHFGERLEFRHAGFDVIEQIMEHRVFRAQDVGDFHDAIFSRTADERSKILQILFRASVAGHPQKW